MSLGGSCTTLPAVYDIRGIEKLLPVLLPLLLQVPQQP